MSPNMDPFAVIGIIVVAIATLLIAAIILLLILDSLFKFTFKRNYRFIFKTADLEQLSELAEFIENERYRIRREKEAE